MLPIDLLRCKLSFFGATKFDPRSDRWVRICMYQDAPYPNEMLGDSQVKKKYTLAEVESYLRKASQATGLGWDLSEEAGKAARWLAAFDLPGPEISLAHLQRLDGKDYKNTSRRISIPAGRPRAIICARSLAVPHWLTGPVKC